MTNQTATSSIIDSNIFNIDKQDYRNGSLFFNKSSGLQDTINEHYPQLLRLYKKMKALDWDEQEFNFESCRPEMARMERDDPGSSLAMTNQIGFQWETDSVAATTVCPIMAGFLTNDTAFKLYQRIGDNECMIEGSEVLTPTGWKDFRDLQENDEVAQYDPYTKEIEFVKPTRIIKREHKGALHHFRNINGHFHQIVTPGHRMLAVDRGLDNRIVVETADSFSYQQGAANNLRAAVVAGNLVGDSTTLTDKERFLIAIQADGSVSDRYDGSIAGHRPVRFSFSKERKITRFFELVERLGLKIKETSSRPANGNFQEQRCFYVYVTEDYYDSLKNYNWVNLAEKNAAWCEDFLEEQLQWDGHFTKRTGILHTTSREAVEVSQAAAVLCGYKTHLQFYPDNRKETFSGCWRLSWLKQDFVSGQTIYKDTFDYEGMVYCVEVPKSFFVCRYEDRVSITGNCVHAATYAEIVRYSYSDPDKAMADVLANKANHQRLSVVAKVFAKAYETSHKLALGLVERNQETFNIFFLYVVALFMMERLQFMASFAVTFSYGSADIARLMPICKAVQKICQDEYEVHSLAGAMMINILWDTTEGLMAYVALRDTIQTMFNEILGQEFSYIDNALLPANRNDIFGVTRRDLKAWTLYCAQDIASLLNITMPEPAPKMLPLSYMNTWIKISSIQASLQEEKNGAYLLGMVKRDDVGKTLSIEGL